MPQENNDSWMMYLLKRFYEGPFLRDLSYIAVGFVVTAPYFLQSVSEPSITIIVWVGILLSVFWLFIGFSAQEALVYLGLIRFLPGRTWIGRAGQYQQSAVADQLLWSASEKVPDIHSRFIRNMRLKELAGAAAVTIFFLWPSLAIASGFWMALAGDQSRLNQMLCIMLMIYVGAIWANARKADAQFGLKDAILAQQTNPPAVEFPNRRMVFSTLNAIWVCAITFAWFFGWWSLATWGHLPSISEFRAIVDGR